MKYGVGTLLIGLLVGLYIGSYVSYQAISLNYGAAGAANPVLTKFEPYIPLVNDTNISVSTMTIPAVDQNGNGVNTQLVVQIAPGSGRTLANIDGILFWTDTQNSIRTAKMVAENRTNQTLQDRDVIYTVVADAALIEGPSAGAALTVATVAAIEQRDIHANIVITGTINPDGSIGPVGGVKEKAIAAQQIGATLFLVPVGQGTEVTYTTERSCNIVGGTEVCTVEQVPQTTDVALDLDLDIREVPDIDAALEYFL